MTLRVWLSLSFASAVAVAACASEDAQFTTRSSPDFAAAPHATVSVFGVYKDGRMSAEAWDDVAPHLAAPLAKGQCGAAFAPELVSRDHELFSAVDAYARSNGLTDELLDKFAPMAKGDLIMVVTVSGHLPTPVADAGAASPSMPQSSATSPVGMRGGRGGMGRRGMASSRTEAVDRGSLELSASLFSTRTHSSVALVALTYSGTSLDDAWKRFVEKLRTVVPGPPCSGWKEDLTVDANAVRELKGE